MNRPLTREDRVSLDDFENMLFDRPEDEKWELIDGRIYKSMVGARWEHHVIVGNIQIALANHLRATKRPCHVFRETFFLKEARDQLAALPDIMVRCGKLPPDAASLNNPILLMEVVSRGGEERDYVVKRSAYQRLDSLKHYVLIARDRVFVDHYVRTPEGWRADAAMESLTDTLRIAAIDFAMPVAEIYRDVIAAESGRP